MKNKGASLITLTILISIILILAVLILMLLMSGIKSSQQKLEDTSMELDFLGNER